MKRARMLPVMNCESFLCGVTSAIEVAWELGRAEQAILACTLGDTVSGAKMDTALMISMSLLQSPRILAAPSANRHRRRRRRSFHYVI
ncbi:unnamed protein product [Gongylonema pulchrum]|uniref:Ketoacyl_synth_N domain-containing protein n=1 Tax=Gongylonema pulchrum TaxID=637853 RepID=A0A183E953_9BILA|nr:unnamed protein product [Gongylonema pulchrum]